MSDITAIGLGLMGSALARVIQGSGHDLTVWNRSPDKMRRFSKNGVATAADAASAIAASPVILLCINDYTATNMLFGSEGVPTLLAGRVVVQLSTGTPKEAREASDWMKAHGVSYLDGAILCGPDDIGTVKARILLSGERAAYERICSLLECLGGEVRYLGSNVGDASALDLAWLTTRYGKFMAIVHAANVCKSEGASLKDFISLFPDDPVLQRYVTVIEDKSYQQCTATLQVWGAALERIQQQGKDAGISTQIPDFIGNYFNKAIDAGFGDENVMALFKVLEQ
jgi:3-hydroxyisobutyrate dehydrogenase-like beta-hydroxyacid dehydrogenase